jgi:hypothetical protein
VLVGVEFSLITDVVARLFSFDPIEKILRIRTYWPARSGRATEVVRPPHMTVAFSLQPSSKRGNNDKKKQANTEKVKTHNTTSSSSSLYC